MIEKDQTDGRFDLGCNYWASHAGVRMWTDWRADVVAKDLQLLSSLGLTTLRVFPLWSEFQPLELLRTYINAPKEYRVAGIVPGELADTDFDSAAGVDAVMFERFRNLANLAGQHNISLIVGLVTGWMSGQMFIPPGLQHLNPLVDAESIVWQVRYVRAFVRAFSAHPAIQAWDLGNECNCMGPAKREQLWNWTYAISSAIRLEDRSRPVISGMHGLSADPAADSNIYDQGELTDILTTHPYPAFTPGCDLDPLPSIRPALHAAAESCLYSDLGGRPCLVEEIGTLSEEYGNERSVADYIRMSLYSAWAHNTTGFLWWCGFDQSHLHYPPYDWSAGERELGLFRSDGSGKAVTEIFRDFSAMLGRMPDPVLPPRIREAVCVLSFGQDAWRVGYGAFILAKQAGFDLRFAYSARPIPESSSYLLPSIRGLQPVPQRHWIDLLERVRQGATLYVSYDGGILSNLREAAGIEVVHRWQSTLPALFPLPGQPAVTASIAASTRVLLRPAGATVRASDQDGNPILTEHSLGQGRVLFLAAPLERHLSETPGIFDTTAPPYWSIYQDIACRQDNVQRTRALAHQSPYVITTEHPVDGDVTRLIVVVNISSNPQPIPPLTHGWRREFRKGVDNDQLPPHTGAVLRLFRA